MTTSGDLSPVIAEFAQRLAPARPASVDIDDELVRDLGYDSLAMVELQFAVEELFQLEPLPADEALSIWTIRDLVELVDERVSGGAGRMPDEATLDLMRAQHPVRPR